jgi:hypothetical protein
MISETKTETMTSKAKNDYGIVLLPPDSPIGLKRALTKLYPYRHLVVILSCPERHVNGRVRNAKWTCLECEVVK